MTEKPPLGEDRASQLRRKVERRLRFARRALPHMIDRALDPALPDEQLTLAERAARSLRQGLAADLGGPDAVSEAQQALITEIVGSVILLQSVDAYLFRLVEYGAVVDKRRHRLWPIVTDRMRVADGLVRQLAKLGLQRKPPKAPSLENYVREKFGSAGGAEHDRQAEDDAPR